MNFRLFWLCVISKCLNIHFTIATCSEKDRIVIFPAGDVVVKHGTPLELYCSSSENSSRNLEMKISGQELETTIVNSTTIKLHMTGLEKQSRIFYCRNTVTNCNSLVLVSVDSEPANVTDFSCISHDLEMMNCTWSQLNLYLATRHYLSVLIQGRLTRPCQAQRNKSIRFCLWNMKSVPIYRQQEKKIDFVLDIQNELGRNRQNFSIDHYSVVKPGKPKELEVLDVKSRSVTVTWSINRNLVDFMPLGVEFKVEYFIIDYNPPQWYEVDTSGLPKKNSTITFQIDLPCGNMEYVLRVAVKSKAASNDFWSDYATVRFQTIPIPSPVKLFMFQVCS